MGSSQKAMAPIQAQPAHRAGARRVAKLTPMFPLHCEKCGHEWQAPFRLDAPCPNCHALDPFVGPHHYVASEMKPLRPAIYSASPSDKLRDVEKACQLARGMLEHNMLHVNNTFLEQPLESEEIAVGNWIVRPRF